MQNVLRYEIEAMIEDELDSGMALERVEANIDHIRLPAELADSLKLYAWAWDATQPEARPRLRFRLRRRSAPEFAAQRR